MSKATKRKHVTREVLEEYTLPEENQQILKILGGRGNNLHEAQTSEGDKFLVSMPTRFRKNVWIKRGDFVMADPIEEGDKVKAEIIAILYPKQMKYIRQEGLWPSGFDAKPDDNNGIQNSRDNHAMEELTSQLNDSSVKESGDGGSLDDDRAYEDEEEDDEDSDDNDDDLFVNTNRPTVTYYYTDDSSEEEEEEGDDDNSNGCHRRDSEEGWIGN